MGGEREIIVGNREDDHILARVDRVLDLDWLREEVADLYCADNGSAWH